MTSCGMSRPGVIEHGPRSRHLEASSHRRHHGASRHAVPTPERTMTPVRHKIRALVGEAAIREHYLTRVSWAPKASASVPGLVSPSLAGPQFVQGLARPIDPGGR